MDRLTIGAAKAIRPGQELACEEVPGLQLRGTAEPGRGSWSLYYRTRSGVRRRPRLGGWPELTVSRARDAARALLEAVARGEDPSGSWQDARSAPTVADLCDRYLTEWADVRKSARAATDDRNLIRAFVLPGLGDRRVADVALADVDAFLDRVCRRHYVPAAVRRRRPGATAPSSARHVRILLSKLFAFAETHLRWRPPNSNPVRGSVAYSAPTRRRVASPDELARLAAALAELQPQWPYQTALIRCLFLTGARVGELASARHADIVGADLVLTQHKTARAIGEKRVPLPPAVLQIIDALPPHPSGYVFGDTGCRHVWEAARKLAGCTGLWRIDARRTIASAALGAGYSLDAIGALFGHTSPTTTRRYAWLQSDPKRGLADSAADAVGAAMAGSAKPGVRT